MERLAAEGTSVRRALNNALLGFFSDRSNREKRRDATQGADGGSVAHRRTARKKHLWCATCAKRKNTK